MPFSDKPWGAISDSDYRDASHFCSACLIDLNEPGQEKTKANCKLPIKEPGGVYNRNAIHAAAAALAGARGGVQAGGQPVTAQFSLRRQPGSPATWPACRAAKGDVAGTLRGVR